MLGKHAQTATEMIAITAVILLLFALVIALVVQKNFFTSLISNVNQNVQECNRVAAIIANFQSNPAYSETIITMQKNATIEEKVIRIEPDNCPNCTYCYHNGTVVPASLEAGKSYLVKTTIGGIEFVAT